jgi:DNA-binding NtrC family response regulator
MTVTPPRASAASPVQAFLQELLERFKPLRDGAVDFLEKPIDEQDLIDASDVLTVRDDLKKGARKNVLDALLARGLLAEPDLQRLVQEHTRLVAL